MKDTVWSSEGYKKCGKRIQEMRINNTASKSVLCS